MEAPEAQEVDPNLRRMEERLNEILGPIEPLLMKLQSVLVWENHRRSVAMMVCVHGLFWFLATTSYGIYSMVSVTAMVVIFIDMWKNKIWPEIRVPPSSPEDKDGWTPIHPRLLSVPEICQRLAEIFVTAGELWDNWVIMRKDRPLQFCLLNGGICTLLAAVGHYIPGLMLSYILVISLLLWPCIVYHSLLQKIYLQGEPLFMRLDYCLKFRGRWPFTAKEPRRRSKKSVDLKTGQSQGDAQNHAEVDTDSDLEDFVPSADPVTTAALARAITDSEDEGGTPLTTPLLSKQHSVNENYTDEDLSIGVHDFVHGIDEMPSFDEVLDQTDDENEHFPLVTKPTTMENILRSSRNSSRETTPSEGRAESMTFVSSHFRDSDSEEEQTLTRQLAFPDIAEVSETESTYSGSTNSLVAAVGASLMQQSIPASVMSAALSGLNKLGQSVMGSSPQQLAADSARVPFTLGSDETDEVTPTKGQADSDQDDSDGSDYSDDTEEAEDFEFLDGTELRNYENSK